MDTGDSFSAAYSGLEVAMKALAEADGDVYLPNPEPHGPVNYVLVCMEPSLGAHSAEYARAQIASGCRNFLNSPEDFILHLAAQRYLCRPGQRYHVTDISKGAMLVSVARKARAERYARWHSLLLEELALVALPTAKIVAVGSEAFRHLTRHGCEWPVTQVLHYSGQAARARRAAVSGLELQFDEFAASITHDDLLASAFDVLQAARIPAAICNATLTRLSRSSLTASRLQLLFSYKVAFESLCS